MNKTATKSNHCFFLLIAALSVSQLYFTSDKVWPKHRLFSIFLFSCHPDAQSPPRGEGQENQAYFEHIRKFVWEHTNNVMDQTKAWYDTKTMTKGLKKGYAEGFLNNI